MTNIRVVYSAGTFYVPCVQIMDAEAYLGPAPSFKNYGTGQFPVDLTVRVKKTRKPMATES